MTFLLLKKSTDKQDYMLNDYPYGVVVVVVVEIVVVAVATPVRVEILE